jgi:uncharacterized protein with FMN-binding domain
VVKNAGARRQYFLLTTIVIGLVLAVCTSPEEKRVRAMTIPDVSPAGIPDGTYPGEFTCLKFTYRVSVKVDSGRISDVAILANLKNEYAFRAESVALRIVDRQTPNVDVVASATTTSKALMKAVENALTAAATPPGQ